MKPRPPAPICHCGKLATHRGALIFQRGDTKHAVVFMLQGKGPAVCDKHTAEDVQLPERLREEFMRSGRFMHRFWAEHKGIAPPAAEEMNVGWVPIEDGAA